MKLKQVFEGSLNLALGEAAMFEHSTVSKLKGKELAVYSNALLNSANISETETQAWRKHIKNLRRHYKYSRVCFLIAKDMSTRALWAINQETGEILGVLSNESGGGETAKEIKNIMGRIDKAAALLNLQLTLSPNAAGYGIVIAYSQRLARLYGAVAVAVAIMNTSAVPRGVDGMIYGMACEVVKTISMGQFGNINNIAEYAGNTVSVVDNALGAAGTSSPFSCPT